MGQRKRLKHCLTTQYLQFKKIKIKTSLRKNIKLKSDLRLKMERKLQLAEVNSS